jgi:hypothetical protein
MSFTNYAAQGLLNRLFGRPSVFGALTSASNIHLGLSLTTPTETGTVTEPVGGSYARVAAPSSSWNDASARTIANAVAISFPQATGSWGTPTHVTLHDAPALGSVLGSGPVSTPRPINGGDVQSFAPFAITIALT